MAKTPEKSAYTSIKERIEKVNTPTGAKQVPHLKALKSQGIHPDRAIPFALISYLELVDWTGRTVRNDKKGCIPSNTPPILERLNIDPNEWVNTMQWNNRFHRAIGTLASLKTYAKCRGQQWLQGMSDSQRLFVQ